MPSARSRTDALHRFEVPRRSRTPETNVSDNRHRADFGAFKAENPACKGLQRVLRRLGVGFHTRFLAPCALSHSKNDDFVHFPLGFCVFVM